MQKKLRKSFILILLIVLVFVMFTNIQIVEATTNEKNNQMDEILLDEEIEIEAYDIKTNTTRDVDMNEIRELISSKSSNKNDTSTTADYKPFKTVNRYTTPSIMASSGSAQPVNSTSAFPYKSTCRIKAYGSNGNPRYATAALVGKKLALTSAHCVFDQNDNNYVYRNWTVEPGYNKGSNPTGNSTGWDTVYYPKKWKETHETGLDWAICVLQADLGTSSGYFELRPYSSSSELSGKSITLLGYPSDSSYGFSSSATDQYITRGVISNVNSTYFAHSGLSYGGFSGGPVFESDNYIVGVNHGRPNVYSYATRVTSEMVDIIKSLR